MTKKLFVVDPMSYNNLSLYDKLLMDNLDVEHKTLIGNIKYEYQNNSNFDINLILQLFTPQWNIKVFELL